VDIGIIATGSYLPEQVVDNEQIAGWTGVPPRVTLEISGVCERRYAPAGMCTSQVAEPAAREALAASGAGTADGKPPVDLLVVATSSPDQLTPPTAAILQHRLGLSGIPAFDVNAACTGFIYALAAADGMLRAGPEPRRALVVGVDLPSRWVNRADRQTACLFGDAAGAVVLGPVPSGSGIRAVALATHGELHAAAGVLAGGTREAITPEAVAAGHHWLTLDGRRAYRYAMETMPKVIESLLDRTGWNLAEVSRFIFHQANPRLLSALIRRIGIDAERVPLTGPTTGNSGAASVPVTLDLARKDRPFQCSEKVILAAVGGGATAGAIALRWY
jgi:3-oxoacyl-(acyl-carrier-protein) synthase III